MTQFTDSLGNPINVGDRIVYPTQQGSSSARMSYAYVDRLIALVEAPGMWVSTGTNSRTPWVREDQVDKQGWTSQYPARDVDNRVIPEKAYIIGTRPARKVLLPDGKVVIALDRNGRRGTIQHNQKVIVVNSLVDQVDQEDL
jgi:hypothetical protein